jgi:uncharacterized protein with HEPN domain
MKKSPENDPVRLRHMLDAARDLQEVTTGKSRADLDTDKLVMHTTVRLIEILGEAARHISDVTRAQHPEVEWQTIADMRNRIIHEYFNVDLDVVWDVVTKNIPPLVNDLERILESSE